MSFVALGYLTHANWMPACVLQVEVAARAFVASSSPLPKQELQ